MPTRRVTKKKRGGRRRMRGGDWDGFVNNARSFFSGANDWLKSSKILSTVANAFTPLAGKFAPVVGVAGDTLQQLGYGRGRRRLKLRPRLRI